MATPELLEVLQYFNGNLYWYSYDAFKWFRKVELPIFFHLTRTLIDSVLKCLLQLLLVADLGLSKGNLSMKLSAMEELKTSQIKVAKRAVMDIMGPKKKPKQKEQLFQDVMAVAK